MSEPKWLAVEAVRAMHQHMIARYSGLGGVRDIGLLEAALARPRQLAAYGEPDLSELGAAYAFSILRNHPFADAGQGTALMAAYTFLQINGVELTAPEPDSVVMIFNLAGGEIGEAEFVDWIRANTSTT